MGYRLREVQLPILPKGSPELRILHFSDLHLTPSRKKHIQEIRSWIELEPDLVISTGDFMGHMEAVDSVLYALEPLLSLPGLYVFGSNDYYAPRFKNPVSYLMKDNGQRRLGPKLPTEILNRALSDKGWKNLNSSKIIMKVNDLSIEARGTDDAHLGLDDYSKVSGSRNSSIDLSLGVTHAPYSRVLESMARDGLDIVFAGHTHGGQIRVPWFGGSRSLTTNCDLPNWRSRGLTKVPGEPYLHVSAGLGYSPFAPIRVFCPSEATLIKLGQSP